MTTQNFPTFRARTTPQLYAECQKEFTRRGTNQAKVINMLMERWLHGSQSRKEVEPTKLAGQPRRRKDIWLNAALMEEMEQRAAADGLPVATWITSLIQSALMAEPVVLERELFALESQVRELSAIGRNLNQIAHHLNSEALQGMPTNAMNVRLQTLEQVHHEVKNLRKETLALVRARRKAWGLLNERH